MGDLEIVVSVDDRRPTGEEQRTEHFEAAADRHDQSRAQARSGEHAFEVRRSVLGGEVLNDVRLGRADRPSGKALVDREHAPAHRAILEVDLRVHEIAALLGVLKTDGEIVARHSSPGLVRERLEEVAGNRRAEQLGEDLAEPCQALDLGHADTAPAPQ